MNENSSCLLLCIAASVIVTLLPKVLPITFLHGDRLPPLLRKWLDFIPVAVMAALVGPDIFIYEGEFNISPSNLFLMVSIPALAVACIFKNYFLTIAAGLTLVIIARYFGWAS